MKKNNKISKKQYTLVKKNKCVSICFISYLVCSVISFLYCPLIISIIGVVALLLGVASFKKKSVEEKEALEMAEDIKKIEQFEQFKEVILNETKKE